MLHSRRAIGTILFLLFLAARVTAQPVPKPIEFERETLDNGLKVIYAPLRQAPVVHVRVLYHVGSRDETPHRQGFAHMFEHMMFRGSAHVAPEQHMKLIGVVGGESNAFTSFDQTVYVNTIPKNNVEMALYLEADRMASFKVNDEIFQTERKIVAEEWRLRYANQPLGPMGEDLYRTAYTTHNYRWTPIGNMDQLRQATSAELQSFFNTYYIPNNACLVIAGDIDIAQTKQWVRRYFGWIPRGPEIERRTQPEPEQQSTRRLIVNKPNVQLTNMYLAFKTTDYKSDDHYALSVLGDILSSGATGRLDRAFVNSDNPSCVSVGAGDDQLEDKSLFFIEAVVHQSKDPDVVQDQILKAVYEVGEKGVTAEELEKVRTQWRQSIIRSRQTAVQIASVLAEEEVFGGDAARANQTLAKIDALKPSDIQAVAQKYFKPQHLTVLQYRPADSSTTRPAVAAAAEAEATITAPVAPSTQPVTPRVASFPDNYPTQPPFNTGAIQVTFNKGVEQDVAGMKVITVTDARLPLASVSLIMPGGSDAEPLSKVGIGGIAAEMMERGAGDMPFLAFSEDLENHGVSLNAVDAGDTTRLQISCTTDQLDYAVGRANQMLTSPMLPSDEFEKFKRQSIAGLVQGLTNPSSVAERELVQNLYPNSTLGRVTTPQTLQAITLDDVKQWYQTYYQLDGAFVVFSGDVTPQRARELTEKLVAGFNRHKKPAPADYSVAPAPPSRRIVLIDNPEGRQAVVRMAARAYDIRSDDKFPGSLAGNILSAGIESRLNRYVRAEKGLTYGCAAYFRPSRHAGQFSGSVDTNPETTGAAIEAMLKVFNDLRADAVPNQELQEAQSRVSGGMVMEMQTVSQQAGRRIDQILNDYPIDYWDKYSEQINKVTAKQVKDVMSEYVKPDQMLFVVVAPAAAVRSQLEKLGTVEVMPMPLRRNAPATAPAAGTARQAMGDFIAWMDQLRTTLEGVKDKPSAEAAAKALDAAAETAKKLAAQSAALMAQGIDPAEAQAVQQELGAKLQQAVEKLQAERQRIDRDATLKEIVGSKINALMDLFSASSAPPAARSQ